MITARRDAVTQECRHVRIARAHTCKLTEEVGSLRHLRHASSGGLGASFAPDDAGAGGGP